MQRAKLACAGALVAGLLTGCVRADRPANKPNVVAKPIVDDTMPRPLGDARERRRVVAAAAHRGLLWVADEAGLHVIDLREAAIRDHFPATEGMRVVALHTTARGELWVLTGEENGDFRVWRRTARGFEPLVQTSDGSRPVALAEYREAPAVLTSSSITFRDELGLRRTRLAKPLSSGPHRLAVGDDASAYFGRAGQAEGAPAALVRVDLASGEEQRVAEMSVRGLALDEKNHRCVFVAAGDGQAKNLGAFARVCNAEVQRLEGPTIALAGAALLDTLAPLAPASVDAAASAPPGEAPLGQRVFFSLAPFPGGAWLTSSRGLVRFANGELATFDRPDLEARAGYEVAALGPNAFVVRTETGVVVAADPTKPPSPPVRVRFFGCFEPRSTGGEAGAGAESEGALCVAPTQLFVRSAKGEWAVHAFTAASAERGAALRVGPGVDVEVWPTDDARRIDVVRRDAQRGALATPLERVPKARERELWAEALHGPGADRAED